MKRALFLAFLAVTLNFSQSVLAYEPEIEITYPFTQSGESVLIQNPLMHESFLDFLRENSVYVVPGKDGVPLFYYSENGTFGCYGTCSNVTMNNYTFGSKTLDMTGLQAAEILNESVVTGSTGIDNSMNMIKSIRESLQGNPQALAEFEKELLGEQEDYLKNTYYENAYGDVWDYALEEMKKNPELYSSLRGDLNTGDLSGAIENLEKYLDGNFDINEAYDLSNLYSAIENRKLGQSQIEELMRNALKRMSEEEGMDLDLEGMEKLSDMLNSEEFKNAMEKAMETMQENPEMFEQLQDLAGHLPGGTGDEAKD